MKERVLQLQTCMHERGLNAVFLTDPANIFYFSGFTGTGGDATLFITEQQAYLLTDSRYTLQAKEQSSHFTQIGNTAGDLKAILSVIQATSPYKVGFENKTISYGMWRKLQSSLPGATLIELNDFPQSLRKIKSADEIACIRQSCWICTTALRETIPMIRPGVRECDIAAELEYHMRRLGAEGTSFETIVASGSRSAMPHGTAFHRKIEEGDGVTIDFGAVYKGYASDMTRTFFVGRPIPELERIYHAVLRAQEAAINNFEPGMTCCSLDAIARNQLKTEGLDSYFTHSLGHGVGIQVHEGISVSRKSDEVIAPGMVFSIEPGVYVDGLGGVRIEDLVLSTENGLEVLTKDFEKSLAIVGCL